MKNKIAIFSPFLDNIGGQELVTLILARELSADIYTTNIDKEKIIKMGFSAENIYSIGRVPKNAPFRHQLILYRFRKLNLGKKYDFYIVSGDWACSALVNHKPNLWYIYSPINELWAFKDWVKHNITIWWQRPIFELWVRLNRLLTKRYVKHVDIPVSISETTKNRVGKYYNIESEIIFPPTETSKYYNKEYEDYYLSVNRLAHNKRVDMQLKAFRKLPEEKLVIVGSYEKGSRHFEKNKEYLESLKSENVKILNWVSQEELLELYAKCKGFLTTSINEDYGMTPIEAMASGKPVIVPQEGGYRETVREENGVIIEDINESKIVRAVGEINNNLREDPHNYIGVNQSRAREFDTSIFIDKIKEKIDNYKK